MFLPKCPSNSIKFPNKLFLTVPNEPKLRKKWINAARRQVLPSPKSIIRCCDDHFDMENDVENWIKFKLVRGKLILKKGVIPHIFDCQQIMQTAKSRSIVLKRKRQEILQTIENAQDHVKSQPEILMTPLIFNEYGGYRATFQSTMKLTIIIGQCFGLNPVTGVSETDATKLRFKIQSWRFAYSLLSILGQCSLVFFCFLKLFTDSNPNLSGNASLVFYTTNCITSILFLQLAMRWPRLCQQIAKTESLDPNIDKTLRKKCNISCILVLSLALLEHVLSDLSGLAGALDCQQDKNLFEAFVTAGFPWVFNHVGYSPFVGIIVQLINAQFTFNWNFADVFVICISLYLTSRMDQVNRRIAAVYGNYASSSFWRTMREDYSRVTYLVRRVDDVIGGIIFISFANNLFFICLQLLHTLAPLQGYEQTVYFVYSFGFLILRSLAVSLIASRVHTASRKPAQALYYVPSAAYCVEVQRFLDQIHGDTIALSGLQFFNVKRGLVLTIAGTIVTYELVLMQFTGVAPTPPPSTITVPIFINTSTPFK